jgi:hypothetical protein
MSTVVDRCAPTGFVIDIEFKCLDNLRDLFSSAKERGLLRCFFDFAIVGCLLQRISFKRATFVPLGQWNKATTEVVPA